MLRKGMALVATSAILLAAALIGVAVAETVFPEIKVHGYDPNPLQTMNADRALDSSRFMVFAGVCGIGAIIAAIVGIWIWRGEKIDLGKSNV